MLERETRNHRRHLFEQPAMPTTRHQVGKRNCRGKLRGLVEIRLKPTQGSIVSGFSEGSCHSTSKAYKLRFSHTAHRPPPTSTVGFIAGSHRRRRQGPLRIAFPTLPRISFKVYLTYLCICCVESRHLSLVKLMLQFPVAVYGLKEMTKLPWCFPGEKVWPSPTKASRCQGVTHWRNEKDSAREIAPASSHHVPTADGHIPCRRPELGRGRLGLAAS
ncbi:hypothetical protein QBC33DRAFT_348050 [Phialemonium atrogriseum]|uniref:Uncharacterized protein n=1 Tax=Phialemonium atrogriseum TaxID=1093897 RepID=A0AAJ0C3F7_9PEZI|nr:uncharacterized protein QBC33DRAFT_348050 [Phialemonium atrogriseum]KAK1769240.1 hypothetical protein QBC33DRAFT_348050 [Phialemonium atrogriseum]